MTAAKAVSIPPRMPIAPSDPAEPNVKGEGAFYIWTAEEIRDLVPAGRRRMVLLPLRRGRRRQRGERSAPGVLRPQHPLPGATLEDTAQDVRPARR